MSIQYSRLVIRAAFAFSVFFVSYTYSFSQALQPIVEACDNGIDDDGDGLIDQYDLLDCPGIPLESCTDTLRSTNFAIQLGWAASENLRSSEFGTPVTGNLNPSQDSVPEIVVVNIESYMDIYTDKIFIFKGDGSNQSNPNILTVAGGIANDYLLANTPTIADLDADGNPELIVLCADQHIRIYHDFDPSANPCMTLWVTSLDTSMTASFDVSAADFDNDGISELYAGNEVYVLDLSAPATPALRRQLTGTGPFGRVFHDGFTPFPKGSSFATDLLSVADCNGDPDCAGLEIAAGYVIYSVDIDPNDGDGYQIKVQRNINTLSGEQFFDGMTTVADVNLDGIPEVLVTSRKGTENGFYLWNKTGYWYFFKSSVPAWSEYLVGGKIVVGNVYDDRKSGFAQDLPEILVYNGEHLHSYNMNRANLFPLFPYWWRHGNELEGSNVVATPALFDFDRNGYSEIVTFNYKFESFDFLHGLTVLYGGAAPFPPGVDADRQMMTYFSFAPAGGLGSPTVVDADADGQAEIVVIGSTSVLNLSTQYRLHVLEAEELHHSTWPSARQVWNQYAYNIVNVNDDLSIPKNQQPSYLEIPGPGSGYRPLNMLNGQIPYYGFQHPKHLTTGDAVTEIVEVVCIGNLQFRVKVRVCNQGSIALPQGLRLTFYRGENPYVGPSTSMGTYVISPTSIVPGGCAELTVVLPFTSNNVYAVANDPGLNIFPLHDSDQFWKAECDYINNAAVFKMNPSVGPSLSLGPDRNGCLQAVQFLQATPGFASYVWQNGATGPNFIATEPGTYWVVAQDVCLNTRSDTVLILVDTVLQHLQVKTCDDTPYIFNGITVDAGTSQPFVYNTVGGCDSTIILTVSSTMGNQTTEMVNICSGDSILVLGNIISTAGVYSQQYVNSFGCDSVHTVTVELYAPPVSTHEVRQICPGDSTIVFGTVVTAAVMYTQQLSNINGCDSLHTVTVTLFAEPAPTTESRQLCLGDSTIVFGNVIQTAGVYSQTFSSANGCDSIYTITVNFLDASVPTTERRQLCPGDSTIVFGNVVQTAGVYSQMFSSVNGCDSVHIVTVDIHPPIIPTTETQSLCPGDSTIVFGNVVQTAGVYNQTFSSINGCDSVHTVTVSLLPAPPLTMELHQLCPGDSVQVFGNYVYTAGNYTQHYSSSTDCDSLHIITVSIFPENIPTQEIRQLCPGDSTVVFGSVIHSAGVFTQIFSNLNGCDSTHIVTVSLFPESVPTHEARQLCPGDSTVVFGNVLYSAGVFTQNFSNVNGCDSIHTITVDLLPGPVPTTEIRTLCPGDSMLVFGQYVSTSGVYTGHFPSGGGCDSLHTITLTLFPAVVPTSETQQICPGDSTLVFGQYVYTGGIYSQIFSNVHGCDSLHTITVSLHSISVPTQETLTLCLGDSTIVFGNPVYVAGTFTQTFSDIHGCDSVHIITVSLNAASMPTSETQLLCPGDSTLIFGAYVNTAGLYSQTLTNVHGCDSTHTVEVLEAFLLERHDSLALCPGDSVQVFGNWVNTPSIIQQIVPGVSGCDTLYIVTVQSVGVPVFSTAVTQPDGQHATGSIAVIASAGALYSLNPLQFDNQTVFDSLPPGDYTLYQQFEGCLQPLPFRIEAFHRSETDGLYAPNIILPGSASGNGAFTLYAAADMVNELVYLQIYDRWGTLVFERQHFTPNDISKGWDGYIGPKPANPGVYIWQAMVALKNGEHMVKKGDLTIVR